MLADRPAQGSWLPSHVTVVKDEDPTDTRIPRRGGQAYSAEVDRLLRDYSNIINPEVAGPSSSYTHSARSARRR